MNPLNPQDWFIKASRDLLLAKNSLQDISSYPDLICYHCQQAAEKFLKALVLHHGLPVKKTHDLVELLDILKPVEVCIDITYYDEALKIKFYAVNARYPDTGGDPSDADVFEALASAEFFRNFAKTVLGI